MVAQYTSNEVKLAIAGFGGADKVQVQRMVARMLGLEAIPKPADAADALALALHHLGVAPFTDSVSASIGASAGGGALAIAIASAAKTGSVGGTSPYGNARVATEVGGIKLRSNGAGGNAAVGSAAQVNGIAGKGPAVVKSGPHTSELALDGGRNEVSKAVPVRKLRK